MNTSTNWITFETESLIKSDVEVFLVANLPCEWASFTKIGGGELLLIRLGGRNDG